MARICEQLMCSRPFISFHSMLQMHEFPDVICTFYPPIPTTSLSTSWDKSFSCSKVKCQLFCPVSSFRLVASISYEGSHVLESMHASCSSSYTLRHERPGVPTDPYAQRERERGEGPRAHGRMEHVTAWQVGQKPSRGNLPRCPAREPFVEASAHLPTRAPRMFAGSGALGEGKSRHLAALLFFFLI